MLHRTSPPTPALTAARPVMTPRDVVRMLVPSPASTSGTSARPKYTRRPGRLMRLEDLGDVHLDARRGHVDACVLGGHRVADPREHICDRVSHTLSTFRFGNLVIWSSGNRSINYPITRLLDYQLLFVTPVTSPSSASFRKHRRHSPNFRMYARGRPHRWHRLRSRTLNFGVFASFAIFAVVAIYV
jgi:hypothetical protein